MYEWFHPNDDLKENYKRCVKLDTYLIRPQNIALYSVIIPPLEMRFAMYLENNALVANHSPLLSSNPS